MAKRDVQLDKLKQMIKFMEDHNILKLKNGEFQIERGKPEDADNLAQIQEMNERQREEAKRLAAIRLNCPYPCPHWPHKKKGEK